MKIRVGVDGARPPVIKRLHELQAPILLSANSLWDDDRKCWKKSWKKYAGLDIALDSGGFVAMKLHKGYRFTPEQYAQLVAEMKPTWYASMDLCCEPEIAKQPLEVTKRVEQTVENLETCRAVARNAGIADPMPVIQGWQPSDYRNCVELMEQFVFPDGNWPRLVGIGSVCRRNLTGPNNLFAVIRELDAILPEYVKFHLFGVKGPALEKLRDHPRFESMDSMAWNMGVRWHCRHTGDKSTNELRARFMGEWYEQQTALVDIRQLRLI